MVNRLAGASSPYLRAHADNPVHWWAWGPEPFAEAQRRGVPVLVSIGYSTCHWCHVMARESFSDPAMAAVINDGFVAVKVDREEHPEVDAAYLAAASAFTPSLGWPLTVFTTPAGRPFFAGTYWPPQARQGIPGFGDVLDAVLEAWRERPDAVEDTAGRVQEAIVAVTPVAGGTLDLAAVVAQLAARVDPVHGGFGSPPAYAPKFPVSPVIGFLQDRAFSAGPPADEAEAAGALADALLDATVGLADPDGGFYRYATARDWSEPHYERMLYDNAQLLRAYARSGRVEVADGIADFLLTVLREPGGAFRSAQDSESGGVEGGWHRLPVDERSSATAPAIDGKVLTGWNGLAIEALADAGRLLDRPEWIAAAAVAADRVAELNGDGRSSLDGDRSEAPATAEDVGGLANGLFALAVATGEAHWAVRAREQLERVDALGHDPVLFAQGVTAGAVASDGELPSGASAVARARWTLFLLSGDRSQADAAAAYVDRLAGSIQRDPFSFGGALQVAAALDAAVRHDVVVVPDASAGRSDAGDAPSGGLHAADPFVVDARHSRGFAVVVSADQAAAFARAGFELFEAKVALDGRVTRYACADFVCELPLTSSASGS